MPSRQTLPPKIFSFDTIGSRFWIEWLDGAVVSAALKSKILKRCQQFDNDYSRFKDDSLVARLARHGSLQSPPPELLAMLRYAKELHGLSEGAFNITVGPALHALGYGSRKHAGTVLDDPWSVIQWDEQHVHVPKGLVLDFGGLGKGWLIDEISGILRTHGVQKFIVNGGGDLYIQNDTPVEFALEDPLSPGTALRTVKLQNGALAGSDTLKRTWQDGRAKKHHIIDPLTGDSSRGPVVASYVLADTALVADVMATILILRPELAAALSHRYAVKPLLIQAK